VTADLDRRSATPLWRQVLADLTRRVAAGEFTEGFPGEHALRAQYGVSRQTVRQALRTLREEGVVTAERGRAPRLGTPTEIEQPLGALYSLFASVRAVVALGYESVRLVLQTEWRMAAERPQSHLRVRNSMVFFSIGHLPHGHRTLRRSGVGVIVCGRRAHGG